MKFSIGKILWVVGLAGLTMLSISAIDHKRDGVVTGMEVRIEQVDSGDFFLTQEDVRAEVIDVLGEPEGLGIVEVQPMHVEKVLKHNPFIKDADVFVNAEGVLTVVVEQREPMLRVIDNSGKSYYVDEERVRIPVSQHYTSRVVVLTGYVNPDQWRATSEEELTRESPVHDLVMKLREQPVLEALVEQIDCERNGDLTLVPKVGDVVIDFGAAEGS